MVTHRGSIYDGFLGGACRSQRVVLADWNALIELCAFLLHLEMVEGFRDVFVEGHV